MMDAVNNVIVQISDVVWNYLLLFLLVGTGIFFTIRTRFVQVRRFKTAWMRVFGGFSLKGKKAGKDGMSSFQALATAIAAQVGTGNIAGLCDGPGVRRPGSNLLDVAELPSSEWRRSTAKPFSLRNPKQRDENGEVSGRTCLLYHRHVFKGGFGQVLSWLFSLQWQSFLALGFMGNMVQSNSISDALTEVFQALWNRYSTRWAMGLVAGFAGSLHFPWRYFPYRFLLQKKWFRSWQALYLCRKH